MDNFLFIEFINICIIVGVLDWGANLVVGVQAHNLKCIFTFVRGLKCSHGCVHQRDRGTNAQGQIV